MRPITPEELPEAVAVLATAMRDNPLHMRVFGRNPDHRNRYLTRFFELLLRHVQDHGWIWGSYHDDRMIGVLAMVHPGKCRLSLKTKMYYARQLLSALPPLVAKRVLRWLSIWLQHDLAVPHWHIGPLGVLPEYRRQGVGRSLMGLCCTHMDLNKATAWLETDRTINVAFYQGLGFTVAAHRQVLGVPNWFMIRSAERQTGITPAPLSIGNDRQP